jgi:hypothetical protein
MRRQWIELPGVIALVIVVALVSTIQAQAQTPASAPDADTLRTPWGEPDLQGIWGTEVLAPLERPVEIGDREFLTDEEIVALEKERSQNLGRDERAAPGTETDVAGAYNNVWQWNAYKSTSRRTSLIVDPPNGRLPPLTEGAIQRAAGPESYNTGRMNQADGPEDRSLTERCFGSTLPNLGERDYFQIGQSPGYVTIYYEQGQGGGGNRIIPVDGSSHLPATSAFGWATRAVDGRVTHWSSTPPTLRPRQTPEVLARTCASSNASGGSTRPPLISKSPLKTLRRGPRRGPS